MSRGLPNALSMLVGLGLAASILQSATVSAQTIGEVSSGLDFVAYFDCCTFRHIFKQLLAA